MSKRIALALVALGFLVSIGLVVARDGGPGPGPGGPGGRMGRMGGRGFGPGGTGSTFQAAPLGKTETEKKILAVLDEMSRNDRGGTMSVPQDDGRLLRVLAEATGAKNVVELGTSVGYSGIWFCLALKTTGGKLTTFEIDPGRAATARQNFKRADVNDIVTLVEGDAHEKIAVLKDQIDLLFLDADKDGYIDYLNRLLPLVRPGGLVLAHNLTAGQADPRYIQAITTNPDLETLIVNGGLGITLKKRADK